MNESLNLGVHVLNEPPCHEPRTLVVLGLSRGGTSMVAGALVHMGVDMGDVLGRANYEDRALSEAIEQQDLNAVRQLIRERNDRSEVWGWKRPSSVHHLDVVVAEFRNPYYIVVLRDPVAVSTRRQLTMGMDIRDSLLASIRNQGRIVRFATHTESPVLLLSYEKCVQRPGLTVSTIATFAGIDPTDEAVTFIQPDPPGYLDVAAETRRTRLAAEAARSDEVGMRTDS